jgi:hypothetical protein
MLSVATPLRNTMRVDSNVRSKTDRLLSAGFALSRNDHKIILYGQLLTTLTSATDAADFAPIVHTEFPLAHDAITVRRPHTGTRSGWWRA